MRMNFLIPFKTPTINHLYWHRGNIKIMKSEAKLLREKIISEIQIQCEENNYRPQDLLDKKLVLTVEIYENWFTKKNDIKRKDLSNREKFLCDCLFEALGLDDKLIWEHTMRKKQEINPDKEKVLVWLDEIKN